MSLRALVRPGPVHRAAGLPAGCPAGSFCFSPAQGAVLAGGAYAAAAAGAPAAVAVTKPQDRGRWAGTAGRTGPDGDSGRAVTVRGAGVRDRTVRLPAGTGTLAGPEPEAGPAGATAAFRTLLPVLGPEGVA